jgi:GNAT superfamily N-acetyltransferase
MSMYADYLRERVGDEIIEREEGFATFRIIDDGGVMTVYIVDIYIKPEYRKMKMATVMADEIKERAKFLGCKAMIGTVSSSAKKPTDSMKVLLGYGMQFYKSNQDGIIFRKEI